MEGGIRFYANTVTSGGMIRSTLPSELRIRVLGPTEAIALIRASSGAIELAWIAFHLLRIFRNRDYCVATVWQDKRLIHYTHVFPRFWRFPFMSNNDLQLGDIWTAEDYRGRGIASVVVTQVLLEKRQPGRTFWYIVHSENKPSIRLAEKLGFDLKGTGRKWPLFGIYVLGTYQIERRCK